VLVAALGLKFGGGASSGRQVLQVDAPDAAARELLPLLGLADDGWCTGYDLLARCRGVLEQPSLSDEVAFHLARLLVLAAWARAQDVPVRWMTHTAPPTDTPTL
jgi:hypothetical protein